MHAVRLSCPLVKGKILPHGRLMNTSGRGYNSTGMLDEGENTNSILRFVVFCIVVLIAIKFVLLNFFGKDINVPVVNQVYNLLVEFLIWVIDNIREFFRFLKAAT